MSPREDEFLRTLRATFKVEAEEHLQMIATGLLELENAPGPDAQRTTIEKVFRAAHSLKGAARAVNLLQIESLCQSLEEVFAAWKSGKEVPTPQALDAAHRMLDAVSANAAAPSDQTSVQGDTEPTTRPAAANTAEKTAAADTVRITVAKLDASLLEAEEMLTAKLAASQRAIELGALLGQFEPWRRQWIKFQPQARKLRTQPGQAGLAEFFEWSHDYVRSLESKVASLRRAAEQDRLTVGKLVDDLLADSKKLRMLPFATLGALFPKLVRDLCRDQGKQAELVVRGEEVEIDKRILEELKDPLIHLLRNCVDHGIETPERRQEKGKPARARIALDVSIANGDQVHILVSDDGAGIDVERLKAAAAKRGLLAADAAGQIGTAEALALIFEPDISTSPIVTQLSGRGLGLAIVREKTEKLGGRVTVDSVAGAGTTIRIFLPVTLATFRGILIDVANQVFALPTAEVERVVRFKPEDVQTVEGRETLALNGRAVALARLADVLHLTAAQAPAEPAGATPAIILGTGEHRMALAVDAVLDEQEILIKQFSKPLLRVRNIAGATVLGSGEVAPVLNVADLLKSARKAGASMQAMTRMPAASVAAKSILLSEDSITSRLLLKGILESAGYVVTTAVDGLDALTTLRTGQFDLLVSDVEMPRLNGFDLTARVRADRKFAELPVILVTALETREDRERGIDVGANAYLVKSSFDQSNLLEAVRRLI
ncbi:MAG TPA: response regulator [Steroidobacteraceae bacterium]|jgi:two-component system chemotaxis sensor kinase CheA